MKKLNELTLEELKTLYRNNSWLKEQVFEHTMEWADYSAEDCLHGIPHGIRYEIGYCGSWMQISNDYYYEFIEYCNKLSADFCIFESEKELLQRLTDRIEIYRECLNGYYDISDEKWDCFDRWMKDGVETLKDKLVKTLSDLYDTDPIELLDCYIDNVGDDYETDGQFIYETEVRKYA